MSEVCQVQVQLLRNLKKYSLRPSKQKKSKGHVKKPATLQVLRNLLLELLFVKVGSINTILLRTNSYISEVSSLSYFLLDFSLVKRREKKELLREKTRNHLLFLSQYFFHKSTMGEKSARSLLQREKHGSTKSDVSKILFPDIG